MIVPCFVDLSSRPRLHYSLQSRQRLDRLPSCFLSSWSTPYSAALKPATSICETAHWIRTGRNESTCMPA